MPCKYCNVEKVVIELSDHESFCGGKTEQCHECREWILLRDWDSHQNKFHGSSDRRFRERSVVSTDVDLKGEKINLSIHYAFLYSYGTRYLNVYDKKACLKVW